MEESAQPYFIAECIKHQVLTPQISLRSRGEIEVGRGVGLLMVPGREESGTVEEVCLRQPGRH
jgi:hypothetical protein